MAYFATHTNNGVGHKVYCSAYQSFTPSATHLCTTLYLSLAKNAGQAATTATITIQTVDDSSEPTGTILATMGTIADTQLSTTLTWKTFNSSSVVLTGGVEYAIVMTLEGDSICVSGELTDCGIRWEKATGYADGIGKEKVCALNGSWACEATWTSVLADFNFMDEGIGLPEKPINPSPSDTGTGITLDHSQLSWDDGGNADIFDVYFGESGSETLQSSEQVGTTWDIPFGSLDYGINYGWRIDATNDAGTTTGDTWTFTTISFYPPVPSETNTLDIVKRLVAAAANKIWYEDI